MSIFFKTISFLMFNFFYRFFIKKVEKDENTKFNNIAVLCRGESLNYYKNFKEQNNSSNLIILSNFEKNDLTKSKIKPFIYEKPITIVSNITEPILFLKDLYNLKIYEVYISRFNPKKITTPGHGPRTNYRLNKLSNVVKYLPDELHNIYAYAGQMSGEKTYFSNTGLLSIMLATSYKPSTINIFGMDFFDSEYFYGKIEYKLSNSEVIERSSKVRENYKNTFSVITNSFPNIQFNIYTKSKFKTDIKNVKIFYV